MRAHLPATALVLDRHLGAWITHPDNSSEMDDEPASDSAQGKLSATWA
jgi:hypothetical protein